MFGQFRHNAAVLIVVSCTSTPHLEGAYKGNIDQCAKRHDQTSCMAFFNANAIMRGAYTGAAEHVVHDLRSAYVADVARSHSRFWSDLLTEQEQRLLQNDFGK